MKVLIYAHFFLLLNTSIFWLPEPVQAEAVLTLDDCGKCHADQVRQIAEGGMAHRDQVTCMNCHVDHPPPANDNIPECSTCHSISPHGHMTDCTACHQREEGCRGCHQVHQPLADTSGELARIHCSVCHAKAVEQFQASQGKHRKLECSVCHPVHRRIQACNDCHGLPHDKGMHDRFECVVCHNRAHDLKIGLSR